MKLTKPLIKKLIEDEMLRLQEDESWGIPDDDPKASKPSDADKKRAKRWEKRVKRRQNHCAKKYSKNPKRFDRCIKWALSTKMGSGKGRRAKLHKQGLAHLADSTGHKTYEEFYADLKKFGVCPAEGRCKILGKADKLWGKKHERALQALIKAKDTPKGQAIQAGHATEEEHRSAEQKAQGIAPDQAANSLYSALKGGDPTGKGEKAAIKILQDAADGIGLPALYDAYNDALKRANDLDDGDLVQWLKDDGLSDWAARVAKENNEQRQAGIAAQKATPAVKENTIYSSFSDSNQLFESWNAYKKSIIKG